MTNENPPEAQRPVSVHEYLQTIPWFAWVIITAAVVVLALGVAGAVLDSKGADSSEDVAQRCRNVAAAVNQAGLNDSTLVAGYRASFVDMSYTQCAKDPVAALAVICSDGVKQSWSLSPALSAIWTMACS